MSELNRIPNVVILYNNEEEVVEYAYRLSQLNKSENIIFVVVVNLFQGDLNLFRKKIKAVISDSYIYVPDKNLGYINGLIFGYNSLVKETKISYTWSIFSNTDISFKNKDFLVKFIEKKYDESIWCIAPSVFSFKKKTYDNPQYYYRNSLRKINRQLFVFRRPLLSYYYTRLSNIKAKLKRKTRDVSQNIYSAHGSFFILKDKLISELSIFPYKTLLFAEESYIAEIILKNNKINYYDSNLEVIHDDNSVTGKLKQMNRSKLYYESIKWLKETFYE